MMSIAKGILTPERQHWRNPLDPTGQRVHCSPFGQSIRRWQRRL